MSSKLFLQHDTLSQHWVSSGTGTDELFSTSKLQHLLLVMFYVSLCDWMMNFWDGQAASMQRLKWKPGLCHLAFKSPLLESWGEGCLTTVPSRLETLNLLPPSFASKLLTLQLYAICLPQPKAGHLAFSVRLRKGFVPLKGAFGYRQSRKYPCIIYMDS